MTFFRPHGAGNSDGDCFLAKRRRISPKPASALQRHGPQVEGAGQGHAPVHGDDQILVSGKIWKIAEDRAVGRQVSSPAHFELCDHRKLFVSHDVLAKRIFNDQDHSGQCNAEQAQRR